MKTTFYNDMQAKFYTDGECLHIAGMIYCKNAMQFVISKM